MESRKHPSAELEEYKYTGEEINQRLSQTSDADVTMAEGHSLPHEREKQLLWR